MTDILPEKPSLSKLWSLLQVNDYHTVVVSLGHMLFMFECSFCDLWLQLYLHGRVRGREMGFFVVEFVDSKKGLCVF